MIKKEDEEILKYEQLTLETQSMWNVKTGVITVTKGETRTISNHSENSSGTYSESTKPRNYKNSHIGHCTHTWESTDVKVQKM